jgi:hypothetical protein
MTFSDITNKMDKRRKELDDFTYGMIKGLAIKANWKQIEIFNELDIPISTVSVVVMRYRKYI